jgi:endoglucanase Acf2
MNRSSIFAAASTFVLLVAGILASKANKKFNGPTSVWYRTSGAHSYAAFHATTDKFLTTASTSGNVAFFYNGSAYYTLVTSSSSHATLYSH